MKKQIKDFKFLDTDENELYSRATSIIDWIQEGIIEVHKVAVMEKKWRKRFGERYIGVIWGVLERVVVFSDRDII